MKTVGINISRVEFKVPKSMLASGTVFGINISRVEFKDLYNL